jgi:hypothetical protein
MPEQRTYWFPAKRYGCGWGFPSSWQGRMAIAVYALLAAAGVIVIAPADRPGTFVAYLVLLSALLTLVCWLTGEPPRWRWGKRDGATGP